MNTTIAARDLSAIAALWTGRTVTFAWLAYLLIAPTIGFGWLDSWHNEQRAVQVALLSVTALAYCVIGMLTRGEDSPIRWSFPLWVLAFLTLGVISSLRAQFVLAALAEVSMFALLAVLVMLTARVAAADKGRALDWARWFSLLFCAAYVLGVGTRYLAAVNLARAIDLPVFVLGYSNPRFPSALHTVLIPLVAMTVVEPKELKSLRVIAAVILAFIWAINLGLGTRGIWFAYALATPLTAWLVGWKVMRRMVAVLALTALAGVALYFVLFSMGPTLSGTGATVAPPTSNLTLTSRDILWQLSWHSITSSPLLGLGPMQFATLNSHVGAHPHNWPLQVAAEWGLPALGLLAFAILRAGKALQSTRNGDGSVAAVALAISSALCLGLVDGNLIMPISQTATFLGIGLLIGVTHRSTTKMTEQRFVPLKSAPLTAFLGMLACGTLIEFASSTLPDQMRSIEEFHRSHVEAWLVPRFWQQGILR